MADLKNIGQMGVNEVFEDLAYNVAYGEIYNKLNKVIPLDDGYLKDALQSGAAVMFSGALMYYMQKQDVVIQKIFDHINKALIVLLSGAGSFLNKLTKFKGKKLTNYVNTILGAEKDRNEKARMVIEYGSMLHQGQIVSANYNNSGSQLVQMQNLRNTQNTQKLDYAKAKLDATHKSLLLKLFTQRFTADDVAMIKKITGSQSVDIDNLNKIANFMYVTDDSGNITGLTEQFMTMLNGLGYLNNKQNKG
uniref:hypothetical protein n=1 Tax=Campylobacter hyointestinalis TaxID=198 RepID=UPI003AF675A6